MFKQEKIFAAADMEKKCNIKRKKIQLFFENEFRNEFLGEMVNIYQNWWLVPKESTLIIKNFINFCLKYLKI